MNTMMRMNTGGNTTSSGLDEIIPYNRIMTVSTLSPSLINSTNDEPTFLGFFSLSTHHIVTRNDNNFMQQQSQYQPYSFDFPYEALIAALAIGFFRYTVCYRSSNGKQMSYTEPRVLRILFSFLLGYVAYNKKHFTYHFIMTMELFSYVLSHVVHETITKIIQMNKDKKNGNQSITTIDNNSVKTKSNEKNKTTTATTTPTAASTTTMFYTLVGSILSLFLGLLLSYGVAHFITSPRSYRAIGAFIPAGLVRVLYYFFPISEVQEAYEVLHLFMFNLNTNILYKMLHHLLFVTFHVQCGMGYLGISFLRQEQTRKNELIRLDVEASTESNVADSPEPTTTSTNGTDQKTKPPTMILRRARKFQKNAAPFIFGVAVPYMFQIIIFGNMNQFAYNCVSDEFHRLVRIHQVFQHDQHFTAMATGDTPLTPTAYAGSMEKVISTVYDIFNRKLFSLPKICLLPTVMSRQPMLIFQVFPFIFVSDYMKASVVSYMTTSIERLQNDAKELKAIRTKIESFDLKNAELLQRSGSSSAKVRQFTQRRWEALTVQIQARDVVADLMKRSKEFFAFLQRNFVFSILIDCALAQLIAIGKILTSEVFVFSRAIEDAIDLILMRSRSEAELARMQTEITRLKELNTIWSNSRLSSQQRYLLRNSETSVVEGVGTKTAVPPPPTTTQLHCRLQKQLPTTIPSSDPLVHDHPKSLMIRNLHYTRGTAAARADHLELNPGVYALTGSNGSGKSTLFRILMSCNTNDKITELPPSINLLTPSEPLTEEEDILREQACLEDDEDEEKEGGGSCAAVEQGNGSNPQDGSGDAIMPHHVPKLSIIMPSSKVVEISQNFYWPLYSKPIDWIFEEHISAYYSPSELDKVLRKVAEELHSLQFFTLSTPVTPDLVGTGSATLDESQRTSDASIAEETIQKIMSELVADKEDWFSELSGGQKSKVELVRTVFLRDHCPDLLLIDETMAPLDPASKELVMAKLKIFCRDSIIIVIYHTDVGLGKEVAGKTIDCVPSNNFFDRNIHLEKGIVHQRETC